MDATEDKDSCQEAIVWTDITSEKKSQKSTLSRFLKNEENFDHTTEH